MSADASRPVAPGASRGPVVELPRRAELVEQVVAAARDAARGDGGPRPAFVVLDGAAGSGRSVVLDQAVRGLVADGAHAVRASGVPWEAGSPYGLLRQLVPDLPSDPGADPFAVAEEVWAALARGAGGAPVLVAVDDADLADPASLQALSTGTRHHPGRGVVVVATRTTGSAGPAAEVLDRAAALALTVPALSGTEVAALAAGSGVVLHPSLAAHLARHTAGNPAHVLALLATAPVGTWRGAAPDLPAPEPVVAEVRARLADLDADARALVEAVAVLGDGALLATAAAVADVGGTQACLAACDRAEEAGLLRSSGGSVDTALALRDPMVAAAVRRLVGAVRRSELHRRAADVLTDEARRLVHRAAAEVRPDAGLAASLESLAAVRASDGAWSTAAELFLTAWRCSEDAGPAHRRLLLAVDALVGAGDVPAASTYLAEVESLPETAMRNAVLGYVAIMRGRAGEATARLTRAWQLVNARRDPGTAASIAQRHVLHSLARCDGRGVVVWADRTVELVGPQHPTAIEAQAIRGLGLGSTGRLEEALASYRVLAQRAPGGAVGQRVGMGSGWLHLVADEVDVARSQLTSALATDDLGGSVRISLWAHAWLARAHFLVGEWDRATEVAGTALDVADRAGIRFLVPLLRWTLTQVSALRGDWSQAESQARAEGAEGEYDVARVPACLARAALHEARADYGGVLSALAPLVRDGVGPDVAEPGFWPWPDVYANALVMSGRLADAQVFLDEHERRAADRGHRSARARLGYARGRLLGAQGDLPAARGAFESSLELLAPLPLVYDRARTRFAYGQTLRRAGKRREADRVVTDALDDFAALGATTYVRRCERELRAGGVRAVLRDRPPEALTPQEVAVASLVATGSTNREVAAELFLSEKTVQFHLTRVYAKLGVRSRAQLAALPSGGWRERA